MAIWFILTLIFFLSPQITFASTIVINEIYPNPPGGGAEPDEFIELYNKGEEEVNLSGWSIDDVADGGSKAYFIAENIVLAPNGFIVFYRADSKVALNNTGDEVNLVTPEGEISDQYIYEKVKEETVFGRDPDGGEWSILQSISPGRANSPPLPTNSPKPTVTPRQISTPKLSNTPKPSKTPRPTEASVYKEENDDTVAVAQALSTDKNFFSPLTSNKMATRSWQVATVAAEQATVSASDERVSSNKKSDTKKKSAIFVILGGLLLIGGGGLIYKRRSIP